MEQRGWRLGVKRVFDVAIASTMLVAAAPVVAVAAAAVAVSMGRPVFFKQTRPGRGGRPFDVYKLRTMRDAVGHDGRALPDSERLTPTGRVLRATSLDELPQLWNVIRGEMSLVGPRPLLVQYLQLYSPEQARRHDVLPGITGWAQINGRNATDWSTRLANDVWYVDHWSLRLDALILGRTLGAVLRREGVSHAENVTMPVFTGTERVS